MRELAIRSNVGVAVQDGLVSIVDDSRAVAGLATEGTTVVDANGSAVIPGLVDPHTHAVFAGDRRDEFARRVAGESYLDILAAGGGINSTVAATREASLIALRESFARRAARMLHHGATTIEVKSGYGLTAEHESLLLAAAQTDTTRVVKTFLGAHALPVEYSARRDDYVALVIEEMLPEAVTRGARFCDVFCEEARSLLKSRGSF
jgi:imidazolonepropionase